MRRKKEDWDNSDVFDPQEDDWGEEGALHLSWEARLAQQGLSVFQLFDWKEWKKQIEP